MSFSDYMPLPVDFDYDSGSFPDDEISPAVAELLKRLDVPVEILNYDFGKEVH